MMYISRRLTACRPRDSLSLVLVLLLLPVLALTWKFISTDVTNSQSTMIRDAEDNEDIVPLAMFSPGSRLFAGLPANESFPVYEKPKLTASRTYTAPEVFLSRQSRLADVCKANPNIKGSVHGVFPHIKTGVLYCFVPKAGCTFWKQVFNYVNLQPNDKEKYKTPWDFPRLVVHNNKMSKGNKFDQVNHIKNFPMRVVVSRDPFSRIISSYLDKFYLPDFWIILGMKFKADDIHNSNSLLSNFFTDHFNDMAKRFRNTYRTGSPRDCGSHLTFAQFLRNALKTYEPHWIPVHNICNPCKLKPTHVVTMETFTSDARVIMKQLGIDEFLDGFDPVEQTNTEIETIVEYNFERVFKSSARHKFIHCVSPEELAYRLWNNFQWRGYIHPAYNYTIPPKGDYVKEDLLRQLSKARIAAIKDPASCKKHKEEFKIKVFKSIDKSLFESLVKKFEVDTELFGHEKIVEKMRKLYT